TNPATQYVPPTDLPAVPEIPACLSPLTSASPGGAASEGRVEGQAVTAAVPFDAADASERTGAAAAVFLLSGVALGLRARHGARR
ncbi:MAG TPA: hypothetical protein VGE43_01520, partial [Acidimicrobiales bacterium]